MQLHYDDSFNPAAPIVQIGVGATDAPSVVEVRAILDTGSELTFVPESVVQRLGLQRIGMTGIQALGEPVRLVPYYPARIWLGGRFAWFDEVVATSEPYAILGRGVLNRSRLTLDGPGGIVTIE